MAAHEKSHILHFSVTPNFKKGLWNCEITVTKCKHIFIKQFVQLRFNTLRFILVFSIHPKFLVSNTKWFNNRIDKKSSSGSLNKLLYICMF